MSMGELKPLIVLPTNQAQKISFLKMMRAILVVMTLALDNDNGNYQ